MIKTKNIVKGWGFYLFDKNVPKWAIERVKICAGEEGKNDKCIHFSSRVYPHCLICKCHIGAKARVLNEKCPVGKWNNINAKRD